MRIITNGKNVNKKVITNADYIRSMSDLKASLEEKYGEGQEEMWGNFDVTIKEVSLEEPKIILKMICAG